jgi:hypothetical protein
MYDATNDSIAFASCSGVLGLLMSPASHAERLAFNTPAERIQSHGLHTRCLRFAATVTRVLIYGRAKLAPGWWHTFAGRGFHPLGSFVKFQLRLSSVASSSPRLCLTHERRSGSIVAASRSCGLLCACVPPQRRTTTPRRPAGPQEPAEPRIHRRLNLVGALRALRAGPVAP